MAASRQRLMADRKLFTPGLDRFLRLQPLPRRACFYAITSARQVAMQSVYSKYDSVPPVRRRPLPGQACSLWRNG